ncbi:hypothetical protein [Celerinatantimonas sp. YJH-8]|uniref:hypothetical protein n=1 Tax=Celerinatantimonas sp. YJH-8 TaxID=3228714 RepID=UPI0038C191DD
MKLYREDLKFLIYFLPLFILKIMNITADSKILMVMGVISVIVFCDNISNKKYSRNYFYIFSVLLFYSLVLVITNGKYAVFFSIMTLVAMKDLIEIKNVYKICFYIGSLFLIIALLRSGSGQETTRYIDGEWQSILKRNNILYVAYTAIICLYILFKRDGLKIRNIFALIILSYLAYKYIGSRTGFVSLLFFLIFILLFKIKAIKNILIIKYSCILSPLILMLVSLFTGLYYEKYRLLFFVDALFQGRIAQNNAYLNRYDIKLLGQHIYENMSSSNYWVLDSAYIDMLIQVGVISSILWIIFNIIVIKYMYDKNRMVEVGILLMYTVYGFNETFLPNCFLNMSFFIFGEFIHEKTMSYKLCKYSRPCMKL